MPRLLFEKTGRAVWISHLDLMRLFQRAFKRAGLPLTHTKGFNPRPSVSIALPLSLGVSSCCELLDFDLEGEKVANEEILTRLNENLVAGVKVLKVYDEMSKIKHLPSPQATHSLKIEVFNTDEVICLTQGMSQLQLEVFSCVGNAFMFSTQGKPCLFFVTTATKTTRMPLRGIPEPSEVFLKELWVIYLLTV